MGAIQSMELAEAQAFFRGGTMSVPQPMTRIPERLSAPNRFSPRRITR